MTRKSLICFWIVATATAFTMVACGGTTERTRIQKRGRDRDPKAGTLGKLTPAKCGDKKKEILDLKTLNAELEKLNADPSYTYVREMTSHEFSGGQLRVENLGPENPDKNFGKDFFARNRIGLSALALNDHLERVSLFRFDNTADSCTKVVVRLGSDFPALESVDAIIPDGETRVRDLTDGDMEIDFEIDLDRSDLEQLVLKGPADIWLIYRVDRGAAEVTAEWISPSKELFCEGGEEKMHVLNFQQVLSWSEDNVVQLTKPFVGDIKTYLKSQADLDKIEDNGNFYDLTAWTAFIVHQKPDSELNLVDCGSATDPTAEPVDPATAASSSTPEEEAATAPPVVPAQVEGEEEPPPQETAENTEVVDTVE